MHKLTGLRIGAPLPIEFFQASCGIERFSIEWEKWLVIGELWMRNNLGYAPVGYKSKSKKFPH